MHLVLGQFLVKIKYIYFVLVCHLVGKVPDWTRWILLERPFCKFWHNFRLHRLKRNLWRGVVIYNVRKVIFQYFFLVICFSREFMKNFKFNASKLLCSTYLLCSCSLCMIKLNHLYLHNTVSERRNQLIKLIQYNSYLKNNKIVIILTHKLKILIKFSYAGCPNKV